MSAITLPGGPVSIPRRYGKQSGFLLVLGVTILLVSTIFPRNFVFFRAQWLLHPFEQEHLTIARNLAHGNGLTISDPSLDPAYGSEDKGYVDGRFVPRSVLLPYLIYAVPFFISDSAWLYVTPLFSLLAALACFAIVWRRTGSAVSSAAGALAFYMAAPVLLASSGVAYESMIALAFVLWAAFFAEGFRNRPDFTSGALAGLMFACAANSREDYAPAGLLFVGLTLGWLIHLKSRRRVAIYPRMLGGAVAGTVLVAAGIGGILLTNYAFTGNPLHSAYGPRAWFATPEGLGHGLLTFRPHDFLLQARLFLWEIAKPTLPLLALSLAAVLWRGPIRWADLILVGFSAFLILFHLERTGSHGSTTPVLVASPPRYILPVYATAAVCAISALHSMLASTRLWAPTRMAILAGLAVIMASTGVREAFTNRANLPLVGLSLEQHRAAHAFSEMHPDALFVGDIYTKGIIVTERTLIPRLTEPGHMVELVNAEISGGRPVYVTDNWPSVASGPYYSGYAELLRSSGLVLCPAVSAPLAIQRVLNPDQQADNAQSIDVPAGDSTGRSVSDLEPGASYYVISRGSFINSASGGVSAANYFWIDGQALKGIAQGEEIYCARFQAGASTARVTVADRVYTDNRGTLRITLVKAD